MSGVDEPERARRTLFKFATAEDISEFVVGSDQDIGGSSTAKLDLGGPMGTARLHGQLSLAIRPEFKSKIMKSGYIGIRNKKRTTLFGEMTEDLTFYDYLVLRVRDAFRDELWSHKLETLRNDGGWEDVYIPFDKFQLKTNGQPDGTQVFMDRRAVWMFGISFLARPGVEGEFELGIHSIDVEGDPSVAISDWERDRRPDQHHVHNRPLHAADEPKKPNKPPIDKSEDQD
ncbi:CIA30-domain-containing protein [Auriculariales sp. MPI-PUGE-AT-0066]|nr:CIA30-domain-containing protein [Auriculariales sp. MPI-PUGE-AT-0066]